MPLKEMIETLLIEAEEKREDAKHRNWFRARGYDRSAYVQQLVTIAERERAAGYKQGLTEAMAFVRGEAASPEGVDLEVLRPDFLLDADRLAEALHNTIQQVAHELGRRPPNLQVSWGSCDLIERAIMKEACQRVVCDRLKNDDDITSEDTESDRSAEPGKGQRL